MTNTFNTVEEELRKAGYTPLQRFTNDDKHFVDMIVKLPAEGKLSAQATRILKDVLPKAIELFLSKNADYSSSKGYSWAESLGDKAQFVDMWRKMTKLHRGLWEGEPLRGEPVEEILMDLIGHCLLALDARSHKPSKD